MGINIEILGMKGSMLILESWKNHSESWKIFSKEGYGPWCPCCFCSYLSSFYALCSKRAQSKAQFVTPASRAVTYSNTPMVTPKFDPRLVLASNHCT